MATTVLVRVLAIVAVVGLDMWSGRGTPQAGGSHGTPLNAPVAVRGTIKDTEAYDINAQGDIVGGYGGPNTRGHSFLLRHGHVTTIADPKAVFGTSATGSNAQGDIVGTYLDSGNYSHGFLLHHGRYTSIDDPQAVPVPGLQGTEAYGINAQGDIVGTYADSAGKRHGFLLRQGRYTTIDVSPGA